MLRNPLRSPLRPLLRALGAAGSVAAATGAIRIATYGDSRATLYSGAVTGDMYNGTNRNIRASLTNQSTPFLTLPIFMNDAVLTADGGVSGEITSYWNNPARNSSTKAASSIAALDWDVILIQYGTNDVTAVSDATTRDSYAAAAVTNIKACINYFLATGRKVVWQTAMQRTSAGFGANAAFKLAATDIINYGNGGAIDGLVPWCQAQGTYGSQLYVHDIQALINAGGVSTGAYADTPWLGDGTHVGYYGARRIAASLATLLRTLYPSRGFTPMYRAVGNNFVPAVSASYFLGPILSNCSASAYTYGTDAQGRPYAEVTITPNNVTAGSYKIEIHADVGTNAGRTAVGGTFAVNDLVESRVYLTVDDGSGGVSVVNNVAYYFYCTYIGGTPAQQTMQNGQVGQGTALHEAPDVTAQYLMQPMKMTGDSTGIGAPSASTGLRMYLQFYFGITPTPFRIRWTAPEIRKVV